MGKFNGAANLDPSVEEANPVAVAESPAPDSRSSPAAVVATGALALTRAGSPEFRGAITGARSYPGAAYLSTDASISARGPASRVSMAATVLPPGAGARPDAHPGASSGGAGSLARGEGKRRAAATEGNGEWKKLKGGSSPVPEKEHHIVVDGSSPLVAGKQVVAGDIGQGEEAVEGDGVEGWQVDVGDVEANEGDSAGEQVGAGDVEDSEGASEDEEDGKGAGGEYSGTELLAVASSIRNMNLVALMLCLFLANSHEDEEDSEGASEDEEDSEGAGGDCGQVGEGSCKDTATSSRKRRKDPTIEIMENILQTMQAHCAVVNKFLRGGFRKESIKEAMGLAVDCGAVEGSVPNYMATKLFVKAEYRAIFRNMTTREGRLSWLKRWCQMEGLLEA